MTVADDAVVRWLSGPSFWGYREAMLGLGALGSFPVITTLAWESSSRRRCCVACGVST